MHHGMIQMMDKNVDEFYYITLMNENYEQPNLPADTKENIIRGLHKIEHFGETTNKLKVRLIGSGTILNEVIAAAGILLDQFNISSEIFSATSFTELAKEARTVARENRLANSDTVSFSHVEQCLPGELPVIAATDYVVALPQLIAPYLDARFVALGTDGFGRSDQREVLREFFEVDRKNIALAAIESLVKLELLDRSVLLDAVDHLAINRQSPPPWTE
jgi:pyruvate dehydrogenase E1 component